MRRADVDVRRRYIINVYFLTHCCKKLLIPASDRQDEAAARTLVMSKLSARPLVAADLDGDANSPWDPTARLSDGIC